MQLDKTTFLHTVTLNQFFSYFQHLAFHFNELKLSLHIYLIASMREIAVTTIKY